MWRDKLLLLENQWPGIVLPSEEGIIQYYEMGGTDPIAWARRCARFTVDLGYSLVGGLAGLVSCLLPSCSVGMLDH